MPSTEEVVLPLELNCHQPGSPQVHGLLQIDLLDP